MPAGFASALRDDGAPALFGRSELLARLHKMVDGVAGRGWALLVKGDPGIGKTAVLSATARRAERTGARVLHTTGAPFEADLPFAGLHQIVLPLLDQIDGLPPPQRVALSSAFGMTEAPAPPDRFLIGLAVLELLSDAADRTLVIADDAQWLDASTANVLAFVARRLEHEPVGLLIALRPGDVDPFAGVGLNEILLTGLDRSAAEEMLVAQGRQLAADVRDRLVEQAQGNPLALTELPVGLTTDELSGGAPLPESLPLTAQLEQAFAAQATALPLPTRALLLLAACDDASSVSEILEAAGRGDGHASVDDLGPAVAAGLVDVDAERVTFRHPLIRSAIQQMVGPADLRAAHAALADVLRDQPDREVCHRAEAVTGPDERVAVALDQAAERAHRRGAIGTAIRALERASRLSEDDGRRGQLLLRAGELAFQMGQRELGGRLMTEAQHLDLPVAARQRMSFMRIWFADESFTGHTDPHAIVSAAESAGRSGDSATAVALLLLAATWANAASAGGGLGERILRVSAALDVAGDDPQLVAARAVAATLTEDGDAIRTLVAMRPSSEAPTEDAMALGVAATSVGDFVLATWCLSAAVDDLRAQGRVALLAAALVARALAHHGLDRFDLATGDADEGRRLCEEAGSPPSLTTMATATAALVAAVRGEVDRTRELTEEIERAWLPFGRRAQLARGQWARGLVALGEGRHDEAFDQLSRVFRRDDPAWHHAIRHAMIGDLAEAARAIGRVEEARAHLAETEAAHGGVASPATRTSIEYARVMLSDDIDGGARLADALRGELADRPFLCARLQLALGTRLRRERRVIESRPTLQAARSGFDALHARGWAERAGQELRAAGVEVRPRQPNAVERLTPQELHIARLAANGLTNREIGQRLFLSHRTVGAHLYRAFPKLGVTARAQLGEAIGTATA